MVSNRNNCRFQRGAALVEFSIVFMVFFVLILAIIEFSLVVYDASRLAEATRAAARYAIVNTPACNIFGNGTGNTNCTSTTEMICPGADPVSLSIQDCDVDSTATECRMIQLMDQMMLRSDENSVLTGGGSVRITYTCSEEGIGEPELPDFVPIITVSAENIQHPMMFSSILGFYSRDGNSFGTSITLPSFETTRIGEDMYTE